MEAKRELLDVLLEDARQSSADIARQLDIEEADASALLSEL